MDNLEKLLATPTVSERLASREFNRCSNEISISIVSSRIRLITVKETPRKTLFSADDMNIIRKYLNVTYWGTLTLVRDLKIIVGFKVIESSAKEKMHYNNHKLDSFFEHKELKVRKLLKI